MVPAEFRLLSRNGETRQLHLMYLMYLMHTNAARDTRPHRTSTARARRTCAGTRLHIPRGDGSPVKPTGQSIRIHARHERSRHYELGGVRLSLPPSRHPSRGTQPRISLEKRTHTRNTRCFTHGAKIKGTCELASIGCPVPNLPTMGEGRRQPHCAYSHIPLGHSPMLSTLGGPETHADTGGATESHRTQAPIGHALWRGGGAVGGRCWELDPGAYGGSYRRGRVRGVHEQKAAASFASSHPRFSTTTKDRSRSLSRQR